jgi:glycosyltransferase involved in cell wall biosynthesis
MAEAPATGPLAGRRMLFVAPDDYPAFRVDLTELFSRHLVGQGLSIDWSLYRVDEGKAGIDARGRERFLLPAKLPGGVMRKLRNRLSTGALRWGLVWRTLRGEYDLVQVRDYIFWGIPFLIAARLAGKPLVYWMSYPMLDARWLLATKPFRPVSIPGRVAYLLYAAAGKLVYYRFLRHADHVVVQSKRMRERLEEHGVPQSLMTPVEMGVTTERFNPDRVEHARDPRLDGRKVIGYMCAEFFGETFDTALAALAHTRADGHDAVMVAVGTLADHERAVISGKLAALGIPEHALVCTGRLPLPEALSYIKAADVCISPFLLIKEQEVATPTKLVEYLAMGRPVVASVHYDQSEVLSSSGAGLITALSGRGMGEGVSRILADPQWGEEMGAKGPAWIKENRDYVRLAEQVERLFAMLLRERDHPEAGGSEAAQTAR